MEFLDDDEIDQRLGARLRAARLRQGLTLEALAERTGVSRAMISRVERAESSPTAALLVRLGSGLGLTLSALLDAGSANSGPLSRQGAQPVWRDPASGYLRRNVSPRGTGSGFEIVEVVLPAGAHVVLDSARDAPSLDQQVWVLEGELELTLGETCHQLAQGDCLQMHLRETISYRNTGSVPVRYAVILAARSGTFPGHAA